MTDLFIDQLGRVVQWAETPFEDRGAPTIECNNCIYKGNGVTERHCLHTEQGPLDAKCSYTQHFVEVKHD